MHRIVPLAIGLLLGSSVLAAEPVSAGGQPAATTVQSAPIGPASADKVYPPLPTLSLLPPPADDENDDAPPARARSTKKKLRIPDTRYQLPPARLVVSDASRAYLKDVEQRIEVALAR
jgi:hypothetical protein